MPHHNTPVRHAGLAEINELVARLYMTTPDVADEVRELLQAGLQRRDGGISLPPRLLDRVVSGPGERRATLRDWIMPITQRISGSGRTRHTTPAPEHGGSAHRQETPRRTTRHRTPANHHEAPGHHNHVPRRTSRHETPTHHEAPVGHHGHRHASRHATPGRHHHGDRHVTPAPQNEAPVAHHAPRQTSRHATPGHNHRHGSRHAAPAHLEAPVAHQAPRRTSRHGTPGHHHGTRHARHEAAVSYIYEPVDSMGDQTAVPRDVLSQLARPIVTQSMIDFEDATCVICQDDIKVGDEVMLLPCSHWSFHAACIEPWLRRSNTCPSCRRTVE
ncbi:hypothetical protein N7494_006831 [Penicillium frequentans]|uniref:RING-type domain-containing protein n=1 Tax=Penicillium frequentans TaxID=3151616 RepID=A0AAD6GH21_9EURO|nr:hypothetical protein N7494_006831 [Penicillium glabrum]